MQVISIGTTVEILDIEKDWDNSKQAKTLYFHSGP